jgi:hypothetical protein
MSENIGSCVAPAPSSAPRADLKGSERFTPGPWRWEVNITTRTVRLCGGPPKSGFGRYDLTVLDFTRWGMNNAAPVFWDWNYERFVGTPKHAGDIAAVVPGREHHERWFRSINHPDAHLIAAAPDLYAALKHCLQEHGGFTIAGEAERMARAALAKASATVSSSHEAVNASEETP